MSSSQKRPWIIPVNPTINTETHRPVQHDQSEPSNPDLYSPNPSQDDGKPVKSGDKLGNGWEAVARLGSGSSAEAWLCINEKPVKKWGVIKIFDTENSKKLKPGKPLTGSLGEHFVSQSGHFNLDRSGEKKKLCLEYPVLSRDLTTLPEAPSTYGEPDTEDASKPPSTNPRETGEEVPQIQQKLATAPFSTICRIALNVNDALKALYAKSTCHGLVTAEKVRRTIPPEAMSDLNREDFNTLGAEQVEEKLAGLVDKKSKVVVMGTSLSSEAQGEEKAVVRLSVGSIKSVGYTAPEYLSDPDKSVNTEKQNVWALGVFIFQLCTGHDFGDWPVDVIRNLNKYLGINLEKSGEPPLTGKSGNGSLAEELEDKTHWSANERYLMEMALRFMLCFDPNQRPTMSKACDHFGDNSTQAPITPKNCPFFSFAETQFHRLKKLHLDFDFRPTRSLLEDKPVLIMHILCGMLCFLAFMFVVLWMLRTTPMTMTTFQSTPTMKTTGTPIMTRDWDQMRPDYNNCGSYRSWPFGDKVKPGDLMRPGAMSDMVPGMNDRKAIFEFLVNSFSDPRYPVCMCRGGKGAGADRSPGRKMLGLW